LYDLISDCSTNISWTTYSYKRVYRNQHLSKLWKELWRQANFQY
jgi:hypothetical protein